jgi:hypothetical protein
MYTKWPRNIPNGFKKPLKHRLNGLKIDPIAIKYTKSPRNRPNGLKIDQMAIKYLSTSFNAKP